MQTIFKLTVVGALALPLTLASFPSRAQQAPAPSAPAAAPAAESYVVKGFRSAHFGMTKDEVKAAVAKDFAAQRPKVEDIANPADGTSVVAVTLGRLEPAPGTATVSYIFGKQSQKLMHVNVVWLLEGAVEEAQRETMVLAGLRIINHLQSFTWRGDVAVGGVPAGPNSVILFSGRDAAGAALEVRADGVAYEARTKADGAKQASPPAQGPARLRIAYAQNPNNPDVLAIEKGDF